MFCSNCGSQVVGNGKFCTVCGKAIVNNSAPVPAVPQSYVPTPHRVAQENKERKWEDMFREGWRTFFGSPTVLITAIFYTAVQLVSLISMNSTMNSMDSMFESLGVNSSQVSEITSSMGIVSFLALVPGILTVIGMWLVYADSKSHYSAPINTTGLSLIKGIQIFSVAALVVAMIIMLTTLGSVEDKLSSHQVSSAVSTAKTIIIVVMLACFAFYGFIIYAINGMKQTADYCTPVRAGTAMGLGVVSIIFGALSLLGLLSAGFTLSGFMSSGASIMLGVVLCQYKTAMDELGYTKTAHYSNKNSISAISAYPTGNVVSPNLAARPVQTNEYVPAWKRVQLGQTQPAPVVQQSVRTEVTAKMCPECGTTQSGDNRVCFYCGAEF